MRCTLLILSMLMLAGGSVAAETINCPAVADTYIAYGMYGAGYPVWDTLKAIYAPEQIPEQGPLDTQPLLKFDLSGLAGYSETEVVSAVLHWEMVTAVTGMGGSPPSNGVTINATLQPLAYWDANGDEQPDAQQWNNDEIGNPGHINAANNPGPVEGSPTVGISHSSGYREEGVGLGHGSADVTAMVQWWVFGNFNNGLMLKDEPIDNPQDWIIASIERLGYGTLYAEDQFDDIGDPLGLNGQPLIGDPAYIEVTLGMPGDVNGDGFVGGTDLTTILSNWAMSGAFRSDGDLTGDGFVGGGDYTEVLTYWGTGCPPEAVPEPISLLILAVGVGALMFRT